MPVALIAKSLEQMCDSLIFIRERVVIEFVATNRSLFYYGPGKLDLQHWVADALIKHTCICISLLVQETRHGPMKLILNFTHRGARPYGKDARWPRHEWRLGCTHKCRTILH